MEFERYRIPKNKKGSPRPPHENFVKLGAENTFEAICRLKEILKI